MSMIDGTLTTRTEQTVTDRPAPGLARGRYPVPAWVVLVLGAVIVLFGIITFVRRALSQMRRVRR